jgi:hypothetical protein
MNDLKTLFFRADDFSGNKKTTQSSDWMALSINCKDDESVLNYCAACCSD